MPVLITKIKHEELTKNLDFQTTDEHIYLDGKIIESPKKNTIVYELANVFASFQIQEYPIFIVLSDFLVSK